MSLKGDGWVRVIDDTAELEHVAELLPEEWLAPAAMGNLECVAAINDQFDLGYDGVILEGASPDDLAPIVEAHRAQRDASRFSHPPELAPRHG